MTQTTAGQRKDQTPEPVTALLRLSEVRPNTLNPRRQFHESDALMDELVASVREVGLLQPIVVTPAGVIIAGHRRLIACKRAGLEKIPVIIRDLDEAGQIAAMLIENLQRRSLNPVETGRGCAALRDRGLTMEQIAVRTGLALDTIRKHLQLLALPDELQAQCVGGELQLGYVPLLAQLRTAALQLEIARDAIRERWRLEELRRVVDRVIGPPPRKYSVVRDARSKSSDRKAPRAARAIELFTELTTLFRRDPEIAREPAVKDWLKRLAAALKEAS